MNNVLAILLAIILGTCLSFSQTRNEKHLNVTNDSIGIIKVQDTLGIKNKISVTTDTTSQQSIVCFDTVRYNSKMQNIYKNTFKLKNNAFREKMKEPWLGDVLRDIFFK